MKKVLITIITIYLIFMLSGCEETKLIPTTDETEHATTTDESSVILESSSIEDSFGSIGALSNETFTIEEMLIYAIQDEYVARAEYEYILENFDVTRPFSNIIRAEETHISLLLPLFEEFNLDVPEDTSADHLILVSDLQSTYETGVIAEEYNIAMYNLFLKQPAVPDSIIDTFTKLRDASISHLGAFQKQVN